MGVSVLVVSFFQCSILLVMMENISTFHFTRSFFLSLSQSFAHSIFVQQFRQHLKVLPDGYNGVGSTGTGGSNCRDADAREMRIPTSVKPFDLDVLWSVCTCVYL